MSQNVRVLSISTIDDFRNALVLFCDDAKAALGSVEMEIRRTTDWLVRDQVQHWSSEVKKQSLAVSEAQAALFRRKMQQRPGSAPNDSEQKEELRNAKRRQEQAEEKLRIVKKWIPVWQQAVAEYHSRAHPLGDSIEGDLRNAVAKLDRMVIALDAYTKIAPPSMPTASGPSGGGSSKAAKAPVGQPEAAAPVATAEAAAETETKAEAPASGEAPGAIVEDQRVNASPNPLQPEVTP